MRKVKVACAQIYTELGNEEKNLAKVLAAIDEAAAHQADLIIFPEGSNTGYCFDDREHAYKLATEVPGPFTDALCQKAREKSIHLGIGLFERAEAPTVYNSSFLIDSRGAIIGQYQKNFFIAGDKYWFELGRKGFPVFQTQLGRLAFFICADGRIPEIARCAALAGAQVLLNTSCWGSSDQYEQHVPTRAVENRCYVAAVTKPRTVTGRPDKEIDYNPFTGNSFIMNYEGEVLAKAGKSEEEIIYAEIEPELALDKKVSERNDLFADRRSDLYQILTLPFEDTPISKILEEPVVPERSAVQVAPVQVLYDGDPERSLALSLSLCFEAATKFEANVLVLPELFMFDPEKIGPAPGRFAKASREALDRLENFARQYSVFLVASLVEEEEGRFFSTAYLTGPKGVLGKYRKVHLWDKEKDWACPGDSFPVFSTPHGYFGMMLGYDGMFPEAARCLALRGADLLLWPSNWQFPFEYSLIARERAIENQLFVVASNRPDSRGSGGSLVIQPLPEATIAGEYPLRRSGYTTRLLKLANARVKKIYLNTDVIRNRRPETYGYLV